MLSLVEAEDDPEKILVSRFQELYPTIEICRPHCFFQTVQRLVAPVRPSLHGTPALTGTELEIYLEHVWEPRIQHPRKGTCIALYYMYL